MPFTIIFAFIHLYKELLIAHYFITKEWLFDQVGAQWTMSQLTNIGHLLSCINFTFWLFLVWRHVFKLILKWSTYIWARHLYQLHLKNQIGLLVLLTNNDSSHLYQKTLPKSQISLLIWVMDNGSYDNAKSKHTFFKQVFDYNW